MKNKKLELISYQCQCGMYFTEILKLNNGYIVYSKIVKDAEWNFFFGFTSKSIKEFNNALEDAIATFKQLDRTPTFVISPLCKISKKVRDYIFSNYEKFGENVTLLTRKFDKKFPISKEYNFRKINNDTEQQVFVETFKTSKSQTLPEDTYDALPPYYAQALNESFNITTSWNFIHFLSLYNNSPIGMVSTCVKSKFCGIYGGGTYVKHRNKGVFTNLLNFVNTTLAQNNVKYYFGITEKDSKNEKYYNSIGWKSKFTSVFFKQKELQ